MQIAIDGPAGAGKSTVAKMVADKLGYLYIDTGAMYRALTYFVLQEGLDPHSEEQVYQLLQKMDLRLIPSTDTGVSCRVFIGEQEITEEIRKPTVSQYVSIVASHSSVRTAMVELQRRMAALNDVVMDGRDIGTTVLPNADLKIFLSASVEERAKRRYQELLSKGVVLDFDQLIAEIKQRDLADSTRAVSPLRKAEDAVEIDTTELTVAQVVEQVLKLAVRRENSV
ncbi:MAG: (d)CMP kinase [Firmicutes bacterium]|jgi:cytidylate kinase|nr:(d)CMP kinase [Bacillota bacterium]